MKIEEVPCAEKLALAAEVSLQAMFPITLEVTVINKALGLATLMALVSTIALAGPPQSCQPVAGPALEQFYPVMPGWTRGKPTSETDLEEKVSRTTVNFDRGTETIGVELMDSCRDADVLLMLREVLKQFPPGGPGTTQKHVTVNGYPGYEEFTAESGHGEIHVLVADRFMVKVTGDTTDLRTVQNAARQIPMQKLALAR